ncbi:centrosomal protein of 170 kDa protein B [Synchiropus splendidus]|uniref:centrosomal protein of 170 kDa protein B n=1 Tax=Synchiropus splendidus TaxID=270530 RepID=UPI00237D4531|nr:centrosomal protein of 170 kDa protein B [Synchiropus splendidus]
MSVTSWFLVSSSGTRHRLPREMIFVGRDDCELMLQSRSVDKQHAVINYDPNTDEHMVKDLGSLNGTFVNDLRIPDQTYITLKLSDIIRFGYDSHVYILEKSQHKVPEEALKHEKYTSQLQLSIKALEAREKEKEKQKLQKSDKNRDALSGVKLQERVERKAQSLTAVTDSPISKPSPLYGQPSWWGEDENPTSKSPSRAVKSPERETSGIGKDVSKYEITGSLSDNQAKSIFSYRREPSYFEIPTKELQQRPLRKLESQVHEVPTKDTPDPLEDSLTTSKHSVVQSHASFTIEFDECSPGKMKIKDHVTKFSFRQQRKAPTESAATPTEVVSAESKVVDWLVQSNASMMRRQSQTDDVLQIDQSLLKNKNQRELRSHDDPEDSVVMKDLLTSDPVGVQMSPHPLRASPPQRLTSTETEDSLDKSDPHQDFPVEIYDENIRKKRSQSFTTSPESPAARNQSENPTKSLIGEKYNSPQAAASPPTQRYTIPLKSPASPALKRNGSLRRERSEVRISSSSVATKPFGSVGRKSKLAQEFSAELLKQSNHTSPTSSDKSTPSPQTNTNSIRSSSTPSSNSPYEPQTSSPIHRPVPLKPPIMPVASQSVEVKSPPARHEEEDSLSDAGTYTIEADVRDKELEEARGSIDQAQSAEAPKWRSCWASLADSYTDSGRATGVFDISSQMDPSELAAYKSSKTPNSAEGFGTGTSVEKSDRPTPMIHVHYDPQSTFDVEESSSEALRGQDSVSRLSVHDDLDPDSLSDASKSDDGSVIDQRRKPSSDTEKTLEDESKATSFYIGSDDQNQTSPSQVKPATPLPGRKNATKTFSTATLTKPKRNQDPGKMAGSASAPVLTQDTESNEIPVTLVRQRSFTKDQPSNARLPNISTESSPNQDTHSYLKETENALAALEAKLKTEQSTTAPSPVMDSLSGESDIDTSSSLSHHSNKTKPNLTRKPVISGIRREKSSASIASQDSNYQSSTSERLYEKQSSQRSSRAESVRRAAGLRRSAGKCGSTDFSDDPQTATVPYSDHESHSYQTRKKYTVPLQKEDGKGIKISQVLSRASSLSAPRPTRASMLRRARLGEASDNEGAETERMAQETASVPAKQPPTETKKLSKWDMLAMPRKRTSSIHAPSDSEATGGRNTGFSNRSTELGYNSTRRSSTPGPKPAERPQKPALNKTPITRVRSSSAKYSSSTASSRRRQKGTDYTSTSDEEYDSNQSTPKPKRSQTPSASHSPRRTQQPKSRATQSEDENREGGTTNSWSSHSAEIARLSKDLAKDLAILAREIHDVAGEGDPETFVEESNTSTSTVTAHGQSGHSYLESVTQRVSPGSSPTVPGDRDSSSQREVGGGMLDPVSQVIMAIKENTDQLAGKIKVMFQDRLDVWEEIEAKVNSDNSAPGVKTSNKEISSILKELSRVQRQLEVINTVVEPCRQPEPTKTTASARPSRTGSSRDWRTGHSNTRRGGGPRPSESVRRTAVTPEDVRQGYLV